jgi:hypothetical protein
MNEVIEQQPGILGDCLKQSAFGSAKRKGCPNPADCLKQSAILWLPDETVATAFRLPSSKQLGPFFAQRALQEFKQVRYARVGRRYRQSSQRQ